MGLDVSHDCWSGSYTSFGRFREALTEVAGLGSLNSFHGFGGKKEFPQGDALVTLLDHSDCDGEIASADCAPLADRLEQLIPALEARERDSTSPYSHAERARRFIAGLRVAAAAGENVEFF